MSIEISTGYGENTRPIIGFSLLQPQNDPKKALYLLVSHSSIINEKLNDENNNSADSTNEGESFSSYILLYQILFERSVNIFLDQNEFYYLYEVSLKFIL